MRNYLAVGFVTSILCACGGGSNSTPASAEAPPTSPSTPSSPVTASSPVAASAPVSASAPVPASTPVVQIVVYGDDQMLGMSFSQFGALTVVSPNEPQALQTQLQQEFNDTGITVVNAASGGTSSSLPNELDGMDGGGQPQPARMAASGAQIAIEQHMLNDALGGETVSQYSAYLVQWVQDAQASHIQPVLEEESPVCDGNHPQQAQYVAAMDSVAAQYNIPLIRQYDYINSLPDWQDHMLGCTVPDAYLDGIKAQQEQTVIGPLVKNIAGL